MTHPFTCRFIFNDERRIFSQTFDCFTDGSLIDGEILLFKASLPKSDVVVEVIGRVRQDITTGLDLDFLEALSLLLLLLAGRPWTLGWIE